MSKDQVKKPIALKLARISVILAFIVGLILSMLQLYRDYLEEEAALDAIIHRIMRVAERPSTTAVHNLTEDLAEEVVEGLLEYNFIVEAKIQDDLNIVLAELKRGSDEKSSTRWITRSIAEEFKTYTIPLYPESVSVETPGHLTLVVDKDVALSPFFERSVFVVVGGVIRNLVLAFLLFGAFYLIITKPLMGLSRGFRQTKENPESPHELEVDDNHADDEFGHLTDTANQYIQAHTAQLLEIQSQQEDIKALQVFLEDAINSFDSVIIGINSDANVTLWNDQAEHVLHLTKSEVQGLSLFQVFPWIEMLREGVNLALNKQQLYSRDKEVWYRGGKRSVVNLRIYPLVNSPKGGAVIRVDDVTELTRIEETIIQSEKMLSVGGLAAGMAHEINNPLAGILQNLQVLNNRLKLDNPRNREVAEECGFSMQELERYVEQREIQTVMKHMMDSSKQAAKIVEQMLTFSRTTHSSNEPQDMSELVEQATKLAVSEHELKSQYNVSEVVFEQSFDPPLPLVTCDGNKIQQVFFNLIQNSVHAMHEAKTDSPRITFRFTPIPEAMRIEVEDNGPGMPPDVSKRIFEPFFTTKTVGVGTGLGLAICYFIITEIHGGSMRVESYKDKGTRFFIELPLMGPG